MLKVSLWIEKILLVHCMNPALIGRYPDRMNASIPDGGILVCINVFKPIFTAVSQMLYYATWWNIMLCSKYFLTIFFIVDLHT